LDLLRQSLAKFSARLIWVHVFGATLIITVPALSSPVLQDGAASSAPAGRRIVPASAMASSCLTMVSPHFPPQAQAHGAQTVVLKVVVRHTGAVNPIHIVSGNSSLEPEAMDAVRLWRYRPYMADGQPIDVMTTVRVDFIPGKQGGLVSHPVH
jgi:TonB family protein